MWEWWVCQCFTEPRGQRTNQPRSPSLTQRSTTKVETENKRVTEQMQETGECEYSRERRRERWTASVWDWTARLGCQ